MTLIRVRNTTVATLPHLFRLVLKHIYEPKNMSLTEIHVMQDSFISWSKKAIKNDDEQYSLEILAMLIKKNEEGKFDERKENFKRCGIDYRRFHRLTESMTNARAN